MKPWPATLILPAVILAGGLYFVISQPDHGRPAKPAAFEPAMGSEAADLAAEDAAPPRPEADAGSAFQIEAPTPTSARRPEPPDDLEARLRKFNPALTDD